MDAALETILQWCRSVVGAGRILTNDTRDHAGLRAGVYRLATGEGPCFLKLHRDAAHWNQEVHAYEHWTAKLGEFAPRLLGVHDAEPLALLISAQPGRTLEGQKWLSFDQERLIWYHAGFILAEFHEQATGAFFGPCRRDGSSARPPVTDAVTYVRADLDDLLERGQRGGWLSAEELAVARQAHTAAAAFAGERPAPCHRDYCPANWLINDEKKWCGVIDFEFSGWDVRAADFARLPEWQWLDRQDLTRAFHDGYARSHPRVDRMQIWVARVQYALSAVVWGMENDYQGFAAEGHTALAWLMEHPELA